MYIIAGGHRPPICSVSTIINVPQILLLYQFSLLILQKLYKLTAHYTSVNSYYARHTLLLPRSEETARREQGYARRSNDIIKSHI